MIKDGLVEIEMEGKRRVTRALCKPNTAVFSDDEVKLVERVMDLFRGYSATVVSNISHDSPQDGTSSRSVRTFP